MSKKKNDEGGLSFKEKLRIVKRSIEFIEACDRGSIFRTAVKYFPGVIRNFAGIYLSSLVIDGIAAARPVSDLLLRAAAVCGVTLLAEITDQLISVHRNAHKFTYDTMSQKRLWEKVLTMDYDKAESPETKHKYQNAENYLTGYGIGSMPGFISHAAQNLLGAVMGIVLISTIVFKERTVTAGFMGFIQSPWGFVSVLLLAAGLISITSFVAVPMLVKYDHEALADEGVHEAQRVGGSVLSRALYNYRSGKEIRIYGEQELMHEMLTKSNRVFINKEEEILRKTYPVLALDGAVVLMLNVLMYGFAFLRAASGMMTPGDIVAFVMYFAIIRDGIMDCTGSISQMLVRSDFCKEVFDFLDIPDDNYKGTIPTEKRDDNEYEFEFRHVYFKYPGTEELILKDINLKWRIGEKMALVGRNGSGKSTLVKLLCRLYDPTEGVITLNGIDIKKYSIKEYMELFSVVFQDSALFSFSIAENVAADTEYDKEAVEECVRRAGFSDRLGEMPEGIDTVLYKDFSEKGVEISGGEAQKLCLARAVYKGAPFIVLDEPTAALDPVSEYDIYTKFNSIVGTRTAIYISHRLSSCRFCDDITVLDKGEIVERGSHDVLVLKGGVYAKLWGAQAEYYKDTAGELFV